ncbi:hypothetical protein WD019_02385 [Fictibacillus sp. Mic-4]|uniref:hypothetical protein n=1 Tax=Fictibacillus sp. Mic-4 TaxID=3132826 RepID=UPI003CE8FDE9
MIEKLFIVTINGDLYLRDSSIRTYKSRERAEKESLRFVRNGLKVEIGELTLTNVTEVKEAE